MKLIIKNDIGNENYQKNPNIKIINTDSTSFDNLVYYIEKNDIPVIKFTDENSFYMINSLHERYIYSNSEVYIKVSKSELENIGTANITENDPIFALSEAASFVAGDKANLDNQSGVNTGDETTVTIQTKRPLKTVNNESLEGTGNIQIDYNDLDGLPTLITNHSALNLDDGTNPHGTTKNDVGLSNVDNTSDIDKPISTATQNALSNKADLVGGKVPVSQLPIYEVDDITGLQTALDGKQNLLSSFDESIFIENNGNIEANVSLFEEYFEQQECELNFTPIQIIGVYLNGIKQKSSLYTIIPPKTISVTNFVTNDYIEIQYTHLKQ